MSKHKKVYFTHFNCSEADFIPCELCGTKAVDIHHIEARGMGGSKLKDTIPNLMALCRNCHVEYGDKKHYKEMLIQKHQEVLRSLIKSK
jgi:5-methylcytosine-specific restriction endonuclease McrA